MLIFFSKESLICGHTWVSHFSFLIDTHTHTHCWADASLSPLYKQYFVTCDARWHQSVASCPADWIIHCSSVGHIAHCYLTPPETLSQHRADNNMCEDGWKGEGHPAAHRRWQERGDEWVVEEQHRRMEKGAGHGNEMDIIGKYE